MGKTILSRFQKGIIADEVTIKGFSERVISPCAWSFAPCSYKGKRNNENWESQSCWCLDFDNGMHPDEVIEKFKNIGLRPNVVYNSLRDSVELRKFRICFFLDGVIDDVKTTKAIQKTLMNLILDIDKEKKTIDSSCDKQCSDPARVYLPGKEILYLDESENSVDDFLFALYNIDSIHTKITEEITGKKNANSSILSRMLSANSDVEQERGDIKNFDWKLAIKEIKILNDFANGVHQKYNVLFGIGTNALHIRGGLTWMKNIMIKFNNEGKTRYGLTDFCLFKSLPKTNYLPMRLENFSPYVEDYEYVNIISAVSPSRFTPERITPLPEKMPIQQAEDQLKQKFREAIADESNSIWIFKVETGLGKSQLLVEEEYDAAVAWPTHSLKDEVLERMINTSKEFASRRYSPISIEKIPSTGNTEIDARLAFLAESGIEGALSGFITQLIKDNAFIDGSRLTCTEEKKAEFVRYLYSIRAAHSTDSLVLTTHQKLLKTNFEQKSCYIFDEDPLPASLKVENITIGEIIKAGENSTIDKKLRKSFQDIEKVIRSTDAPRILDVPEYIYSEKDMDQAVLDGIVTPALKNLLGSSKMIKPKLEDPTNIAFATLTKLPADKKIIIFSASASPEIYRLIYGDRIKVVELDNVETIGKVIQNVRYSFSRKSLNEKLPGMKKHIGNLPVITFKKMKGYFTNPSKEIHFGNCSGYDTLKGQDIAVVGTPFLPDYAIKLMASVIGGIDIKGDQDIKMINIVHNGTRFFFSTYENMGLRTLQIGLIQGELIQAIGRSRILRTPATVYVYSNLPINHAEWRTEKIESTGVVSYKKGETQQYEID
jgi:hypothetical protein